MKVVLREDIKTLGNCGDIVVVADGYARNFLLPKKLADLATRDNLRRVETLKKKVEIKRQNALAEARRFAERFTDVSCTITAKVTEEDKLYGSVTEHQIVESLGAQGIQIDKACIVLEEPIKQTGTYTVPVKLHPEVEVSIKVWVVSE